MKLTVPVVAMLVATAFFGVGANAQEFKVGFVDMEHIFENYWKTMRADRRMRSQTQIWKNEIIEMTKKRDQMHDEFSKLRDQSLDIVYSEDVRAQKKEEAEQKFAEYRAQQQDLDGYMKRKKEQSKQDYFQTRARLVEEIAAAVQTIGNDESYAMILDSSGKTFNEIPVFVHYRDDLDVTKQVLAVVNKDHEDEVADEIKKREEERKAAEESAAAASAE